MTGMTRMMHGCDARMMMMVMMVMTRMEMMPRTMVMMSLEIERKTLKSNGVQSTDVIGVEVGGALKNVFALAAGMVEGLGYGYNTMAMLVTRGCAEMRKLAVKMGAQPDTLAGLSGIGDLMLTC